MTEVVRNIYKLSGWWDQADLGANVYLVAEGGTLTLIDTGYAGKAREILKRIYRLGFLPTRISNVIITHHHPDHIGALAALKEITKANIIAHCDDVPYIEGKLPQPGPSRPAWLHSAVAPLTTMFKTTPVKVDIPVNDGDELPVAGGIRILHTPGHTPGSICIIFQQSGAVMTGDLLAQRFGLKLPSMPFTVDVSQEYESISKLAGQEFEVACFGHGSPIKHGAGGRVAEFARRLDHKKPDC